MTADRDKRDGFEALQADVAEHQRRFGGQASGEDNRVFLGAELERVDRMLDEQRPAPAPSEPEPPPLPPPPTIERKTREGREYLLSKSPDRPLLRVASPLEAEFYTKALRRMELLLTLGDSGPLGAASWRDRTLAVAQLKAKSSAWDAAAAAPDQLRETRENLAHDQRLLKVLGLETISQLTPEFCRAKARELDAQYLFEFTQLLEDSNALGFGDWKADPPQTTTVIAKA